ncbi:MAG: hypothetical protein HY402_02100 [Elusimicrobia bacterium]|nr:hypothetical protein [Elusimicrobiota bacterium]
MWYKKLFACLLLPTAVCSFWAVFSLFPALFSRLGHFLIFLSGFAIFGVIYVFRRRPFWIYVFGHELTHLLAALLSGARIHRLVVSRSGGSVSLSKSNAFVALAPYCLPIYTVLLLIVYAVLHFSRGSVPYPELFLFGFGLTLAFHVFLTSEAILQESQSDLVQAGGVLFSWTVILWTNSLCLVLMLKLLFPAEVSLRRYFLRTWEMTQEVWAGLDRGAAWGLEKISGSLK